MRYWKTVQKDCLSCHGRGEVWQDEIRADGYWTTSVQCHCVEHHHDAEMIEFLKGPTLSQAGREGEA